MVLDNNPHCCSAKVANGLEIHLHLPPVPAHACHGMTFTFYLLPTGWGQVRSGIRLNKKNLTKNPLTENKVTSILQPNSSLRAISGQWRGCHNKFCPEFLALLLNGYSKNGACGRYGFQSRFFISALSSIKSTSCYLSKGVNEMIKCKIYNNLEISSVRLQQPWLLAAQEQH
jgi:hypothetical protein